MSDEHQQQFCEMHVPQGGDRFQRSSKDSNGMYKRVLEALIVLAVAALIGAVWNLNQTSTLLLAVQQSQQRDIERIERRMDTVEGRNLRGGSDATHANQ